MANAGKTWGCCLLLAALPLCAQNFGEITGTVADPSAAVVAGATVTVTNTATNITRQIVTNTTGNYTVPFLVPGVYTVRAEQVGFEAAVRTGIQLQVGAVVRVDFALTVGTHSEAVEVKATEVLLATESTAVGTVIENRRIVELPLNGRNYLQLLGLSTNVTAEAANSDTGALRLGGDRSSQNFSIAGTRLQFNNYTLDGIVNTDPNWNAFIFRPSIDALQEFKVETGIYSVEYGYNPGQVSVTTKSGTNQYHGSVFEFLRNSDLDARDWLQSTGSKNPFRRNQYGYAFGGKLIRNRLFFLTSFEGLRDVKTTQTVASVATDRMRSGDFSADGGWNIFDPASRVYTKDANGNPLAVSAKPFAGNLIPQSMLDSTFQQLLAYYPRATTPGDAFVGNYIRQGPHPTNQDQFTARIDYNESSKSFWFGRFGWDSEFTRQSATFANQEGRILPQADQVMLSNIRTLSSSFVNQFRFGWTKFYNELLTYSALIQNPMANIRIIGYNDPGPSAWGTPSISIGNGLTGFGEGTDGPFINQDHVFEWLDSASLTRGRHSLKFGGEVRRDRMNQYGQVFQRGTLGGDGSATFDPAHRTTTGFGLADLMLGWSNGAGIAPGPAVVQGRNTQWSAYAEDAWKVTPKLTLTLGLRYELVPPYHDKHRSIINFEMFDPGVGPNGILPNTKTPVMVRPGDGPFYQGMLVHYPDTYPTAAGDSVLGSALYKTDYNDLAPRLGLAYSPGPRWSIRAAGGVFFAHDIMNTSLGDMSRNLAGRISIPNNTEVPSIPVANPLVSQGGVVTQCSGWSGFCLPATTTFFAVQNDLRTGYLEEWELNIQRQLTQTMSLEVGYLGNEGHKLMHLRDYNLALPRIGPSDASPTAARRPWPGLGTIEARLGEANSNYNGLSAKLTQQFSKGLTYLISYTWSKAIDDASAIRWSTGDVVTPLDNYDMHSSRGLSAYNVGRRFVSSIVYELPIGVGRAVLHHGGVLNGITGGWQLGSIFGLIDGRPINIGTISWNADSGSQYPNATGISPVPANSTASQFWNVQAFNWTDPSLLYHRGNVARNTLTTPGTRSWDFSASKSFRIREGHSLQYRFEAFNLPNHPNWNVPASVDVRTPLFGVIQTAKTMRQLQMALKYSF